MPQRILRFRIRQDGLVEETVEGCVGEACHELTENLEEALGVVEHTEATASSYLRSEELAQPIPAEIL